MGRGPFFVSTRASEYLEFWVLDVQGPRLIIEKTHLPESTPTDLAELDAVVDSIRVQP